MGELHVVDDVVLLGTPVTTEPSKWQKALWVKWKILDGPGAPGGCKGVSMCCTCRKNMLLTGACAMLFKSRSWGLFASSRMVKWSMMLDVYTVYTVIDLLMIYYTQGIHTSYHVLGLAVVNSCIRGPFGHSAFWLQAPKAATPVVTPEVWRATCKCFTRHNRHRRKITGQLESSRSMQAWTGYLPGLPCYGRNCDIRSPSHSVEAADQTLERISRMASGHKALAGSQG